MKKLPRSIYLLFILTALYASLFIGIFSADDTYAHFALADDLVSLLQNGPSKSNFPVVTTIHGPIYGLLITLFLRNELINYMFVLVLFQILLLTASTVLLFLTIRKYINYSWSSTAIIIFYLFPFNLIYTTLLLPEITSSFLVVLYLYVLQKYFRNSSVKNSSILIVISGLIVMTRYALLPFFIVSVIIWLKAIAESKFYLKLNKSWYWIACGTTGICLVGGWIIFNRINYGYWSLSQVTGRHLFNSVVTKAKILPPSDDLTYKQFISHVPQKDIFKPWWENQTWFRNYSESEIDNVYLKFSLAAIKRHPLIYTLITLRGSVSIILSPPYRNETDLLYLDSCSQKCRISWLPKLCTPPIISCKAQHVWKWYLMLNQAFYPTGALLTFLLALIGMVHLLQFDRFLKIACFLFFVTLVFNSASERTEGRFLIPLYPFYTLLITLGLKNTVTYIALRVGGKM